MQCAPARTPQPLQAAVGYIRVSTEEQATGGVSLAAQREAVTAYCRMRGITLAALVEDAGVSAAKPLAQRDGGQRVLDLVQQGEVASVIAWKLDRLFRDASDCLTVTRRWDKADVALHLIDLGGQTLDTSTAMGRFFLTVMAGAAELERNLVGERTSAALAQLKSQGVKLGGAALGWQREGSQDQQGRRIVAAVHEEQQTIKRILDLRALGASLREIAATLTHEGYKTKRGGRWHASTVRAVLAREAG
ncbi:MAG: recombinase family protein [Deltaproteobacteria bacterium]|nr:recombinase family protein [Deltaproteobacteria bacterium]